MQRKLDFTIEIVTDVLQESTPRLHRNKEPLARLLTTEDAAEIRVPVTKSGGS